MGNNLGNSSQLKFKKEIEDRLRAVPIYPLPHDKVIHTQSRRPTKIVSSQHAARIEFDAEPIQGKNEKLLNVADGRKKILDTAKWPNSVHGVIAVEVKDMMISGTGIMIGPRIVLTAGHNLFDFDTKTFHNVKTMQFLPGMNGDMLPFGAVKVERYFVSPNYIKHGKQDYGILILKKPIGEMTGYFGLACLDPPGDLKGKRVNVTGYPGDKVAGKPNTYEMWGMEGEVSEVNQETGHIKYLIDTGEGQNGAGVWYQERGEYYVCGVHRGGQATLLTQDIYKQIYAWVQEVGLNESVLRLKSNFMSFNLSKINTKFFLLLTNYKLDDLEEFHLGGGKLGDQDVKILAQKTSWFNLTYLLWENISLGAEGAKELALNNSWINLKHIRLYSNNIGAEGAKAFAQNTSWVNLSFLYLSDNNLGAEGASALAQNTSWVNLSELHLSSNTITAEGARGLRQNTSWSNLAHLNLCRNQLGDEGARLLAQNTSWINLSKLDLSENTISAEGAIGLAQNTSWVNLSHLNLKSNQLRVVGAKALAENTSWINLSHLDLWGNGIGAEGARGLAQNTSWVNLSQLQLSKNNLGKEGAQALAQNTSWINLSHLELWDNGIGAEGGIGLAQNTSWVNLSHLNLKYNQLGIDGAKALAENTSWINLSHLELWDNGIGAEGAKALAQNTSWTKLSKLQLSKNNLGKEGAKALAQNTSWINLSELDLSENNMGDEGGRELANNTSWINLSLLHVGWNNISHDDTISILAGNPDWKRGINVRI